MINPHGSDQLNPLFVEDEVQRAALIKEAEGLPQLLVSSAAAANCVMLGGGYFNPLTGFMNLADSLKVAKELHTDAGVFFPVPVVNLIKDASAIAGATRIALRDPNVEGNPVIAIQDVDAIEEVSDEQLKAMAEEIFGTLDESHPGVSTFLSLGNQMISGPVQVLNFSYFENDFAETFRTAVQIRKEIADRGWNKVVAFQTRNPMHRAHEELCRMAMDDLKTDGILIHMLLGKLKKGDIPADVRDNSIRKMVDAYFPENSVMITGYGFDMLYAGPREAVLHALFRQNCGCTHFIVGRDHAGVGDYYGAFDAQTIFDERVPEGSLDIEIYRADHTAYSKKLGRVVMMKDAPDHSKDDFILLSGTKVREMLGNGIAPPPEFSRPEVAQVLMDYYQSLTEETAGA
ncbi:Sulfate adenylyltransferase [BD1-7 clade bacterium]|uniref:Sulfate adenylyltransferase n=1 Tax=BD1-7 clade bacterium TaxID=2029982 RepID=A0A5S9QAI3_9GAMM|nr:Sulfate adenylyltransferase [BD1-7 clade bacterium]CAA0118864.1 Sulfate adenylyltransferase [BD1-7 clade bacterium]